MKLRGIVTDKPPGRQEMVKKQAMFVEWLFPRGSSPLQEEQR
jgi:hypothetical protein